MTTTERERAELHVLTDGFTATTIHKLLIVAHAAAKQQDWDGVDDSALWTVWNEWKKTNG